MQDKSIHKFFTYFVCGFVCVLTVWSEIIGEALEAVQKFIFISYKVGTEFFFFVVEIEVYSTDVNFVYTLTLPF